MNYIKWMNIKVTQHTSFSTLTMELNWPLRYSSMWPFIQEGVWSSKTKNPTLTGQALPYFNVFTYYQKTIFKRLFWQPSLLMSNKSSKGDSNHVLPLKVFSEVNRLPFRERHAYSRYHIISIVLRDRFSPGWHLMQ